jgi:adenylyl-sulfate kinase
VSNKKITSKGAVIWLTGLPCSGKTTIGDALAKSLKKSKVERLDGDIVRKGKLSDDLGFSKEDRNKNINRINFVSKLLARNEVIVIASFVSPYRKTRNNIRNNVNNFVEVYVEASAKKCAKRDVKGMWKQAKEGKIKGFTGYDDPYEKPNNPEIICNTEKETVSESTNKIIKYLKRRKLMQ